MKMIVIKNIPHEWQTNYLGALIAVAHIDGDFDISERALIEKALQDLQLHERVTRAVKAYLRNPPQLEECVRCLKSASESLRFSLIVHMLDVALSDGVLAAEEQKAMIHAARQIGVSDEQVQALLFFVSRAEEYRSHPKSNGEHLRERDRCIPVLRVAELPEAVIPLLGDLVFDSGKHVETDEQGQQLATLLEHSRRKNRVLRMKELVSELCERSA